MVVDGPMFGGQQTRTAGELPSDRQLAGKLRLASWWALAVGAIAFPLLDAVLLRLVDDALSRIAVRWVVLGALAIWVSAVLTRRTLRVVGTSMKSERTARFEAEALAELAASVAAGQGIRDTLQTAVDTAARLFGGDVHCSIALPSEDGLLRIQAFSHESTRKVAGFAFKPGEGFNGRAFSEARPLRIDDLKRNPGRRTDVGRVSSMRSMLIAPMIAEQRTLGLINATSPRPCAFTEHDERVLVAIARNVAVALAAAESVQALHESEERYRRLVEWCPDPIVVHCEGSIVYANGAALALAGASAADEVIGRQLPDLIPPEIQVESTTMPITYEGRPAIQAVLRDVTERKRAEEALAHQALHDSLTGLPNRLLLMDRLEQAVASAQRESSTVSLLLMDLDRFKEVNDTLGHHAGDLLLAQVAHRLRAALRQVDTLARLGGDEFAVILPGTGAEGSTEVIDKLLREFQAPFAIEDQPVIVGASIGLAVWPEHGDAADALLRRADVAMYVAKRSGSGFAVYHAEADRNSPDRLQLIGELRQAIHRDELVLHYQPKIDLASGELSGVEALVRWQHPVRGLLSPDDFIPIAEQTALIDSLGQWVLRTALHQIHEWLRQGMELGVAVNLSMCNLQDAQLPDKLAAFLRATEVPASLLVVEITESTLMLDAERTLAILAQVREMGIRVAIDDFGTGHSSLAYLKRLAVDEVKIDRSFVRDITVDDTDRLIVASTVNLAHGLGLRVVAEGVEDRITAALLAELGCDQAQGFHVSPPLRGDEVLTWAAAHSPGGNPRALAA